MKTNYSQQEIDILTALHERFHMNFLTVNPNDGCIEVFPSMPVFDLYDGLWKVPGQPDLFCELNSVSFENLMLDQDLDIDPNLPHFADLTAEESPVDINRILHERSFS